MLRNFGKDNGALLRRKGDKKVSEKMVKMILEKEFYFIVITHNFMIEKRFKKISNQQVWNESMYRRGLRPIIWSGLF